MSITTVSDKTFGREVLGSAMPVVVEFTASQAPANASLTELSSGQTSTVKIVRVNVDRDPNLRDEYEVHGLPTLILFKNGKPVARRIGGQLSESELKEWINGALILALAMRRTSAARTAVEFELANGMVVIVVPDHRAPVVTHMIWYKFGTADEPKGYSGIALLVQHLTHKSLDKIAEFGFVQSVERIGGETNGFTYRDATAYLQRVPTDRLRMVMETEVDRMVNLRLTAEEVAIERKVLLEQRHTIVDLDPSERLHEKTRAALYRSHASSLPLIGSAGDIARFSLDHARAFHRNHYGPNHAVLVVSGDVTVDEVKQIATDTYGKIAPISGDGRSEHARIPTQISARRVVVEDVQSTTMQFCRSYAVPGYAAAGQGEAEALEVLAKILGGGLGSRLFRKLVSEDKVAAKVSAKFVGDAVAGGEFTISAAALDGDLAGLEASIDKVLESVRRNGVEQQELSSAKTGLLANHIYDGDDQTSLATRYGLAVACGRSVDDIEDWPRAISRVSAADVRKVAFAYIIPRRSVTGWLVCQDAGKKSLRTG